MKKTQEEIDKEWETIDVKQGRFVSKYLGDEINIVVPAVVRGATIIGIYSEAFRAQGSFAGGSSMFGSSNKKNPYQKKMYQVRSVVLSDGIMMIGRRAFWGCVYLSEIHIPLSVGYIDPTSFEACRRLTIYASAGSAAEKYAINNNIRFIEEQ